MIYCTGITYTLEGRRPCTLANFCQLKRNFDRLKPKKLPSGEMLEFVNSVECTARHFSNFDPNTKKP